MEKIIALVNKLQELKDDPASLSELSYYTQLLYAEILHVRDLAKKQEMASRTNVSVILPGNIPGQPPASPQAVITPVNEKPVPVNNIIPPSLKIPLPYAGPLKKTPVPATEAIPRRELNEVIIGEQPSLNDQLRKPKTEIVEKLGDSPVKDLHNAIGINDKFRFIQELFLGEEDRYERCIATINAFRGLGEAEYYLQRELMIKLGWQGDSEVVKDFYAIVKKRFSSM